MKHALTAALTLLAAPAFAHELGGAHLHPHVDPSVVMAALIASGVAVWALSRR